MTDTLGIEKARQLYFTWSQKPSTRQKKLSFSWPHPASLFGLATRITYRSDKWREDGQEEKYCHAFEHSNTRILVEPPKGRSCEALRLSQAPIFRDIPPPMTQSAFTRLGYCIHLEYRETKSGEIRYWQFPHDNQPILAVQPERENVLVLAWPNDACWLVTSPILRVTKRGILY